MATCRIVARSEKKNGGTLPLYLRLTHKQKVRRLSLRLRIKKRHWNKKAKKLRKTHPDYLRLSQHLEETLAAADEARRELEHTGTPFECRDLKEATQHALNGRDVQEEDEEKPPRALPYFRQLCDGYEREGKHASAMRFRQTVRKLDAFERSRGRSPRAFEIEHVNATYLRRFRGWLSSEGRRHGEGLAHNTVSKHLKALRTLYYTARREDHASGKNPFKSITITEKKTPKISLRREELERLRGCDLTGLVGEHDIRPTVARDLFCFSCHAQGMRRSDCLSLDWNNLEGPRGGHPRRVRYVMRKNDKPRNFKIVTPAQEILTRYADRRGKRQHIFPALDGWSMADDEQEFKALNRVGHEVNKALREAAAEAGIEKHLTFHVARHTFARLADEAGWPLRKIQAALGHASAKETETYLKQIRGEDLDDDMDALF